ncbi:MAG TPA: hypothetical protein VFG03_22695 [Telluria sp.]|nr:hypothetical protein [Telluria sp.]
MLKIQEFILPIFKACAVSRIAFFAAFLWCTSSHAQRSPPVASVAGEAFVESTFTCKIESNGTRFFSPPGSAANTTIPCAYRLYVTRCQDAGGGERQERSCVSSSLMEFKLKPGERKALANLPAAYRYCIGIGETPSMDECMKSSMKP